MARGEYRKTKRLAERSDQLDLFMIRTSPLVSERPRGSKAASSPTNVSAETISRDDGLASVVEFVLGSERGRGRPEKQLKTGPLTASKRLLDVREAALRLGLSKSTLDKMRCSGRGPNFIRATDRAIRYDPADLDAFADARRRRSTSEEAIAALRT